MKNFSVFFGERCPCRCFSFDHLHHLNWIWPYFWAYQTSFQCLFSWCPWTLAEHQNDLVSLSRRFQVECAFPRHIHWSEVNILSLEGDNSLRVQFNKQLGLVKPRYNLYCFTLIWNWAVLCNNWETNDFTFFICRKYSWNMQSKPLCKGTVPRPEKSQQLTFETSWLPSAPMSWHHL